MKKKTAGRDCRVWLRLPQEQYNQLQRDWKKSTIIVFSEYIRRALAGKPVTFYTRNQSLDELIAELIALRRELAAISADFDKVASRLDTLGHLPQIQQWHTEADRDRALLLSKIDEIKLKVNSISAQWLQ